MRVELIDSTFYRERLDALETLARAAPAFAIEEARHLLELILREAGPSMDLEALETELGEATNLDVDSLASAGDYLKKLGLGPLAIDPP